jgi:hypothetical protein
MDLNVTADINGATYLIGRLNPRKSFHVARRLAPFLGAVMPHLRALFLPDEDGKPPSVDDFALRGAALVPGLAQVVAEMSNDDCDYILDACLAVVQIKQERNWAPIMAPSGQMMFDTIDMKSMLQITAEVIKYNLGEFFPSSQPPASAAQATSMPQ